MLAIVRYIHLFCSQSKYANQAVSLLLYWDVPMLKSTVLDEKLDDVFEEVLEVHWLRVDAYVPLARASR